MIFSPPRIQNGWLRLRVRWAKVQRRERVVVLATVLLAHVLLMFVLWNLAPRQFRPPGSESAMTMINLLPARPVEKPRPRRVPEKGERQ